MALDPEADIDLDDDFVMQELFDEEDMRTELFKDTEKFHAPPSISRNSNISIRHADKMLKSRPKDQRRRSSGMMGGMGAPSTKREESSGRSQDPMSGGADIVAKRAKRRYFSSTAELESNSQKIGKAFLRRGSHAISSEGARVQKLRRASIAKMGEVTNDKSDTGITKDLRRASRQIVASPKLLGDSIANRAKVHQELAERNCASASHTKKSLITTTSSFTSTSY